MLLSTVDWYDHLFLTRDLATPGERSAFFARARRGQVIAIYRGVYVEASEWHSMDRHAQSRARVKAASLLAPPGTVFSHQSAAALWRLPSVGAWPVKAHVLAAVSAGGRSTGVFERHTIGASSTAVIIEGVHVTTLARTVVDLASRESFGHAVAVADAALHRAAHPVDGLPAAPVTRDDFFRELESIPLKHGSVMARRVIDFADGAADRPGESMSRVGMHLARLTPPRLQVSLAGASGRIYIVDFWWPQFNMIGEFDGRGKYSDPQFLRGRTPEQTLYDEKLREDDLRSAGHGMTRWNWALAISPTRLGGHLRAAGIR
ncbi:MAG: hypothetical protein JWO18_512 [Microbacteriaceae bacterium]|nr:hypothetical protein [Microbacteriaceae bacterium]